MFGGAGVAGAVARAAVVVGNHTVVIVTITGTVTSRILHACH